MVEKVNIKRLTDEDKKRIIRDYENGQTLQQIGDKYGVSAPTVRNWLIRWGKLMDRSERSRKKVEEVKLLMKTEKYFKDIAEKLGISDVALRTRVKMGVLNGWLSREFVEAFKENGRRERCKEFLSRLRGKSE